MKNEKAKVTLFLLVSFALTAMILKYLPSYGDRLYWIHWAETLYQYPLSLIYQKTANDALSCNYPPFLLYVLQGINLTCSQISQIGEQIYVVKIITLLFDYLPLVFALYFIRFFSLRIAQTLFFVLNIGYLYNTVLWGQVDAIHTCFIFFTLILLIQKRFFWAMFFLAFALGMKVQSVIFLPIVLLFAFWKWDFSAKLFLQSMLGFLLGFVLLFFPFILSGKLSDVFDVYTHSVGFYNNLTFNAHNIWYFIHPKADLIDDRAYFCGVQLHHLGLGLFALSALCCLLPLGAACFRFYQKKEAMSEKRSFELAMLTAAIFTLCFFYFNTQMHERYNHPMLLFFGMYFLSSGRKWLFLLSSLAVFLNMEGVGQLIAKPNQIFNFTDPAPALTSSPDYHFAFSGEMAISILFLLLLILSFRELYRRFYSAEV